MFFELGNVEGRLIKKDLYTSEFVIKENISTPIYHYYFKYQNKPEEEHKIEKWAQSIDYMYKVVFNQLSIHNDELERFLTFEPDFTELVQNLIQTFKTREIIVRAVKIIKGDYYFEKSSSNVFEKFYK